MDVTPADDLPFWSEDSIYCVSLKANQSSFCDPVSELLLVSRLQVVGS